MALSEELSDKIEELKLPIAKGMTKLKGRIEPVLDKIREADFGYEQLISGLNPSQADNICLRLFDFDGTARTNDRVKARSYFDLLKTNVSAIQNSERKLKDEISSAINL